MNPLFLYFRRLSALLGLSYFWLWRDLTRGGMDDVLLQLFRFYLTQYFSIADLNAANTLRIRADFKPAALPEYASDEALNVIRLTDRVKELNPVDLVKLQPQQQIVLAGLSNSTPWASVHHEGMRGMIDMRAEMIAAVEREFIVRRALSLAGGIKIPLYRLEMHKRDSLGEIAEVSQQLELADPTVSEMFPFALYLTRDDARVRPTHRHMHSFTALRSWESWPIIRPLCGWNCRCFLRLITAPEAIKKGWMTHNGIANFEMKWPDSSAIHNFKAGKFPDRGWHGPKYWSFPTQTVPIARVA